MACTIDITDITTKLIDNKLWFKTTDYRTIFITESPKKKVNDNNFLEVGRRYAREWNQQLLNIIPELKSGFYYPGNYYDEDSGMSLPGIQVRLADDVEAQLKKAAARIIKERELEAERNDPDSALMVHDEYLKDLENVQSTVEKDGQLKIQYQLPQDRKVEEFVASEKTIRDLAARMSDRIGIPVKFESDRNNKYKGKLENGVAVINLAYATLDTPIHEILGHPIIRTIKKSNSELYNNLVKELETGRGKEVLDRVKRDYNVKSSKYQKLEEENDINYIESIDNFEIDKNKYSYEIKEIEEYSGYYPVFTKNGKEIEFEEFKQAYNKNIESLSVRYTLEEQQEEAIVELLGLYTANRLDKVKDSKLISLLKILLKEIKAFMKELLGQREVEIDKLFDNMTLGDLADLLAYSNSKLILPGNEVIYTTPDNMKFKSYGEASKYISDLAKNVKDVDLETIKIEKKSIVGKIDPFTGKKIKKAKYNKGSLGSFFIDENQYEPGEPETLELIFEDDTTNTIYYEDLYQNLDIDSETHMFYINASPNEYSIEKFIERNKEYEQSKEIIEEWKKVNNIQYNPEEIYSRGQEFSSIVGAYSDFDVNLMMQNLLQHIEDNEKAGGKFAISAFTKPIDRKIGHLENGGGKIKFKIYPQSSDILWASDRDVFSGSVWDASKKVNKDKQSELLGVSYTKYPSLQTINTIQPNLAFIVDNLGYHHNELGIVLTGNNFRLEYDEDIPYSTKKIINGINSILDQKYGKLVKPKITNPILQQIFEVYYEREIFESDGAFSHVQNVTVKHFNNRDEANNFANIESNYKVRVYNIKDVKGIQPIQTNETLKESIDSIKSKLDSTKEYTQQALTNTKIAVLKEVAKKYPRSLIRSEVKPIHSYRESTIFEEDDLPFQKLPSVKQGVSELFESNPELANKVYEALRFNKISEISVSDKMFNPDMAPDGYSKLIYFNGEYIGEFALYDTNNETHLSGSIGARTEIDEKFRSKGYGYKAYIELAKQVKADGKVLVSDTTQTESAIRLWDKLVKEGYANKVKRSVEGFDSLQEEVYIIDNSKLPDNQITLQQKQQATFMFSEFLDVYLEDFEQVEKILKEEKIIDKKCS